jgi:membrane-bound lytic murein transglycosylase D
VPVGKGEILLAKIDEIPSWRPPVPSYTIHKVRYGESLSVIAHRYNSSVRAIMNANGLRRSHYLKVGWKLKIPTKKSYVARIKSPPIDISKIKGKTFDYAVKQGDSLWLIANRFGTTTHVIRSLNQLNSSLLSIGQVLKIPAVQTASSSAPANTLTYRVQRGDSPYLIAKRYRMNLADFLKLNKLTPRSTIFPGQILVLQAN